MGAPFPTEPSPVFSALRARAVIGAAILAFLLVLGTVAAAHLLWPGWAARAPVLFNQALPYLAVYALAALLLWLLGARAGIAREFSLGRKPEGRELWRYMALAVPLIGISVFSYVLLFLPLSHLFPEFVASRTSVTAPQVSWSADPGALAASVINVAVIVVVAPVVEEVVFRGFLLNRWWAKYGFWRAVALSSLLFGVLHVNVLGIAVFGVVLSLIHARTQSLAGPIAVHMANNGLLVLGLIFGGVLFEGGGGAPLDELRAYWWLAGLGAAVGIPWLAWFIRDLLKRPAPDPTRP